MCSTDIWLYLQNFVWSLSGVEFMDAIEELLYFTAKIYDPDPQ